MIFEVGKFYAHEAGRHIAIVGEVMTYKWGRMLVVEEADKTGHSISCSDVGQEAKDSRWIEIGREEWLKNFSKEELEKTIGVAV